MGIRISKGVDNAESELVDFGSLQPQKIYPPPHDEECDMKAVRKFIREGRLAPFYRGLNDPPQMGINERNEKVVYCERQEDVEEQVKEKFISRLLARPRQFFTCRIKKKSRDVRHKDVDVLLYSNVVECPICFLYYPCFINRSRCCDKPICTDCFLQLKRSADSPLVPAVCPFCVQPNFGVIHIPPEFSPHYKTFSERRSELIQSNGRRRRRLPPNDPDVVLVDQVRPNWHRMLEGSARGQRRSSTSMSGSGTTRRTVVRPNAGPRRYTAGTDISRVSNRQSIPSLDSGGHSLEFDLEDVMVMEAIRLSLMEQAQEEQRRQAEQASS